MNKSDYPKARNGAKTAIELQKEKRDAIQAAADARKEKAMAARRAKGLPATPKKEGNRTENAISAGVGSIGKYMKSDPLKLAERRKVDTKPTVKPKPTVRPKPTATRVAAESVAAPKRTAPSADLRKVTPTKGVNATSRNRVFTDKEKKIMTAMAKGTKKNGTMKASAQRKIQKIRKSK